MIVPLQQELVAPAHRGGLFGSLFWSLFRRLSLPLTMWKVRGIGGNWPASKDLDVRRTEKDASDLSSRSSVESTKTETG